jgi:dTDP-4-amino-4,6-dideoxygalactose transaminase
MELAQNFSKRFEWKAKSKPQEKFGRPLVVSDAAHSFGSLYKGKRVGNQTDVAGFSFHAVKNLTTAEGGAIALNFKNDIISEKIRQEIYTKSLHGQSKDAISKMQPGNWRYDIVEAGYKCNMTDIHAAIGRVELERFQESLDRRKEICEIYNRILSTNEKCMLPTFKTEWSDTNYHLYMLRLNNFTEDQRDAVIREVAEQDISLNVHFQPLPLFTFYKSQGFNISNFPNAFNFYKNEISLPVYYDLSNEDAERVANAILKAIQEV